MEIEEKMASYSPWKRGRPEEWGLYSVSWDSFWEKFDDNINANIDLDTDTKRAALAASPSIVSIVSLSGGNAFFMGSGTIIESEDVSGTFFSIVLTSSCLLRRSAELDLVPDDIKIDVYLSDGQLFAGEVAAYDFHFNLAAIRIKSNAKLPIATLRFLDDSISIDPRIQDKGLGSETFQLHPHSSLFKLRPGDAVIAIGRYFEVPHDIMAAPGKFSLDCCKFDCQELFRANCKIAKCGIGGPLINHHGEVIGVNFYDQLCTPFLPINIASKCLEHFKKHGRFSRPLLGMEMTNLYAASLGLLEEIIRKFPNIVKGILVEKVAEGSPAECAGIQGGDVIVQCSDHIVQSLLEFYGVIWDKVGESVDVVVIRTEAGARLNLTMKISEASPEHFYRWPLPDQREISVKRIR